MLQPSHEHQSGYAAEPYTQQDHGYMQPAHAQQGLGAGLPAGWATGVDPSSGATYYYDERTGESQWEIPRQDGYPQPGNL